MQEQHKRVATSKAPPRRKKDPHKENAPKPRFDGADEAKTLRVEKGRGLPPPQKQHIHHRKNAPRTRRAR